MTLTIKQIMYKILFFSDVSQNEVQEKEVIVGIVTDIDLLHHVAKMTRRGSSPDIDSGSGGGSGGNFHLNSDNTQKILINTGKKTYEIKYVNPNFF